MKKIILYSLSVVVALSVVSCKDFLGQVPDNRTTVETPDAISKLLVTAYPTQTYFGLIEHRCDLYTDYGSTLFSSQPDPAFDAFYSAYMWDEYTRSESGFDSNEQFWTASYKSIATANHALAAIEELNDPSKTDMAKGEALVIRAYSHFTLLTLFSKFFDTNNLSALPGIPYVTEPEDVVNKKYDRETADVTLQKVMEDLDLGLSLIGSAGDYQQPKFHFTRESALALAVRIALFTRNYNDVIRYSNMLLPNATEFFDLNFTDGSPVLNNDGTPARGVDNNDAADQFMQANLHNWSEYIVSGNSDQIGYDFSSPAAPANLLVAECSSLVQRAVTGTLYVRHASERAGFTTLLDENVTGAPWIFKQVAFLYNGDEALWLPKFFEDFKIDNVVAQTGSPYAKVALFRLEEVLLSRAEAYAMTGDYDMAMADLNMYAACRIKDYQYGPRTIYKDKVLNYYILEKKDPDHFINGPYNAARFAATKDVDFQKALVLAALDFRHMEFMYEGMRYWDILRWNIPVVHTTIDGRTSILTPDDDRRVLQIPQIAETAGLEPNDMINIPYGW